MVFNTGIRTGNPLGGHLAKQILSGDAKRSGPAGY